MSHLEASGGAERFRQAVLTSLTSAFEGEGERRLDAAVIGASGIEQGSALQPRATALLADALSLPEDRVLATGDERTALRGAHDNKRNIIANNLETRLEGKLATGTPIIQERNVDTLDR